MHFIMQLVKSVLVNFKKLIYVLLFFVLVGEGLIKPCNNKEIFFAIIFTYIAWIIFGYCFWGI